MPHEEKRADHADMGRRFVVVVIDEGFPRAARAAVDMRSKSNFVVTILRPGELGVRYDRSCM
jgi:hypothetical protein